MQTLPLVYDFIIFFIYAITITMALLICMTSKQKNLTYVGLLFAVFTVDHLVISLTELSPSFSLAYEQIFLTVPSVKTIVYAFSFYFMIRLQENEFTDCSFSFLKVVEVLAIIILLLIPMLPNSATKSWLYFFPAQVFLFLYALTGIRNIRKSYSKKDVSWDYPYFSRLFVMMLLFSLLIVAEDTYVIFHVDHYETASITMFQRNISEDILRTLMAALSIRTMIHFLKMHRIVPTADVPEEKALVASAEQPDDFSKIDSDLTSEEKNKNTEEALPDIEDLAEASDTAHDYEPVFLAFCEQYQLTNRESEILFMVLKNMTNQEISDALYVSLGTTKTHTHNIFFKIGASRRKEVFQIYAQFKTAYLSK